MSEHEFRHSTLEAINKRLEIYSEEREEQAKLMEHQAWLNGAFVQAAIASAFSKNCKYPENPLNREEPVNIEDMTQAEITDLQEQALKKLDLAARIAFGITDKADEKKSEKE